MKQWLKMMIVAAPCCPSGGIHNPRQLRHRAYPRRAGMQIAALLRQARNRIHSNVRVIYCQPTGYFVRCRTAAMIVMRVRNFVLGSLLRNEQDEAWLPTRPSSGARP